MPKDLHELPKLRDSIMSFVYDIADLYKSETTIPAAFETVSAKSTDPDRKLRAAMRQKIVRADVLKRVADDIAWIFDVPLREEQDNQSEVGKLWDGSGEIDGGKNHGGGDPKW